MTWAQASLDRRLQERHDCRRCVYHTPLTSYFSRSPWVTVVITTELTPCMHACIYTRRYRLETSFDATAQYMHLTTRTSSDDQTSTLESDDWNACFLDASRTSRLPSIGRVTQGFASYFLGYRGGSHHYQINPLHARIYTRKCRLETTFDSNKLCTTYNQCSQAPTTRHRSTLHLGDLFRLWTIIVPLNFVIVHS